MLILWFSGTSVVQLGGTVLGSGKNFEVFCDLEKGVWPQGVWPLELLQLQVFPASAVCLSRPFLKKRCSTTYVRSLYCSTKDTLFFLGLFYIPTLFFPTAKIHFVSELWVRLMHLNMHPHPLPLCSPRCSRHLLLAVRLIRWAGGHHRLLEALHTPLHGTAHILVHYIGAPVPEGGGQGGRGRKQTASAYTV